MGFAVAFHPRHFTFVPHGPPPLPLFFFFPFVPMHLHVEFREWWRVLFLRLSLETGSHWLGTSWLGKLAVSTRDPPVHAYLAIVGIGSRHHHHICLCGFWEPNSATQVLMLSRPVPYGQPCPQAPSFLIQEELNLNPVNQKGLLFPSHFPPLTLTSMLWLPSLCVASVWICECHCGI